MMKNIILETLNKIHALESTGPIFEALTPEEQKELDALAKELETQMGRLPELDSLLLKHQELASGARRGQSAQAATPAPKGDPKVFALQKDLAAAGAKNKDGSPLAVDGRMGPNTAAAMADPKFAEVVKKHPDVKSKAEPAKNPKVAGIEKSLTSIEALLNKAGLATAAATPTTGQAAQTATAPAGNQAVQQAQATRQQAATKVPDGAVTTQKPTNDF